MGNEAAGENKADRMTMDQLNEVMKTRMPKIGIILKDHQCKGGNVWLWTDADGKIVRAMCAGCSENIGVVFATGDTGLTDMPVLPHPRKG